MKKAVKWAVVILLTPVLLFVIAAGLLYLPPVQNWVADRVAAVVSAKTDMSISVGTVRLEWPLDLGIDDLRAIHQGDTLADVGHLTVDVQLRPLLKKRVVVNEIAVRGARINTNGYISDLQVKGRVGELWLRSDGIDLAQGTVAVNGARLADADLYVVVTDTAAVDTTESEVPWLITADSLSISRTAVSVTLPGDTLSIKTYLERAVARQADIDLLTSTYRVGSVDIESPHLAPLLASPGGEEKAEHELSDISLGVDSIYYGPEGTSLYIRAARLKERGGLEVTELTGGVRLDTAFTHVELPHLTLRTPDSDVEAEAYIDFSVADATAPGTMKARLNAQIGKQDLLRIAGTLPPQFVRQYPNHPLMVKGSVNGNVERMEITGLDIQLPTALHVKADGVAHHVNDLSRLSGQLRLQAESKNLNFLTTLVPVSGLRLPPMTLSGQFTADGGRVGGHVNLREGQGTVSATLAGLRITSPTNPLPDVRVTASRLNLYHFLPADTMYNMTADLAADLTLRNGHATGTISGTNRLIDGSIGIDALLSNKRIEATITPRLRRADLHGLRMADHPLTVGMNGRLSLMSDFEQSHELKGLMDSLYIADAKATYHPENIGLLIRTNRDTTLARIQSGDFIVKLDARGGYEPLLRKGTTLIDSVTAQYEQKVIDQQAIKRLLPTLRLHVESRRNNPLANILRTKDIDFKEFFADLDASPLTGINGRMHLYSLNYDSTRIDTINLTLKQHGDRLSYQGQVRNNRKNPQFVFNALIDGHFHEHGALMGVRFYDAKERLGVRLGATASMVSEGVRLQLMPERPTIGYKEFSLNADNYLLIGRNNRVEANVALIADDKTGLRLYSEHPSAAPQPTDSATSPATYLQDLTLSVNQLDLGELTAVMPYLPRITGRLNGDFHLVIDQEEQLSVVSDMSIDAMALETSPIGNLSSELVYMQREDGGHAIEARLMLDDEEFGLLQGTYIAAAPQQTGGKSRDHLDATFTMSRFPLSLANGFVPDRLIGLEGYGEGTLDIKGTTEAPLVNGEVYVDSAYLVSLPYGVRMRFDNDPVRIVGSHLLLENFGLYAYNDEPLNLQGDIDFSRLDRIVMDMRMRARNLHLINARQEPGSVAFGNAFVNFFARLNGPIETLQMRGRLDVLGSTDMTYMLLDSPLSTDNRLDELVKFTDFTDTTQVVVSRPTPSGLSMDLTVSVSEGAHIVCDLNPEQTNYIDLMGGGDLRLRYNGGTLTLNGRYTLTNGEMKYSLPVIPLKTFTIRNGSYVEFTGDPMNPRLNITATERTKATVGQDDGQSRPVTFDCGVVITKTLNDMGLQFTIDAPEDMTVSGELQSMSAEERGKLAVTMLTTGMYLADGNTSGFSMNSALSSFLQSEINNITGSALKTLDLSVGLDNTTDASGQMHTDYSFKFSKRLFDNRLKIQLGGKVSTGAADLPGQQQSFFDNVTMEYRLDPSAQKNVKLYYQQNVYDWLEGYTGLYGAGFVWRRKMDTLWDVFKIFSNDSGRLPATMRPQTGRRDSTTNDTIRHDKP